MSTQRRRWHWWGVPLGLVLVGCAPQYDGLSVRTRQSEPGSAAGLGGIQLRQGEVLLVEVRAEAVDDPVTEVAMDVDLTSADGNVAGIRPAILTDVWAINGIRVGTTQVLVDVDGELQETIEVQVQEASR
ncbi:MAG: hypothetical protein AB1Z98_17195 [Nannocystaceae bacterium]